MSRQLTPDFAQTVKLPMNPFRKHGIVKSMIEDSSIIGEDVEVMVNPTIIAREGPVAVIALNTVFPLLGRGQLKRVARALDYLDSQEII